MKNDEKFIQVLTEMVKELIDPHNRENIKEAEKKAIEKLVEKGFSLDDIFSILDDIFSVMNINQDNMKVRIIHPSELANFTDNAREYLFSLKRQQVITEQIFEEILALSSASASKINRREIEEFLKNHGIPHKKIIN
jgi:uncharacterized protein Smg (DUF494 family)